MKFRYIEYIPPPFKRKKILPVRPKIFENEKEKRKILNSPKDGPIATQLQVRRITNRSNHRSSSPRIFFTSPQTFSCTKKKKKKKKKWRSFSSTHVHEPRRDEFIRGSGRSRRKLETARSLNEIAAVSRYPAVFWFPFWRGNLNVVAIDSSAARAERILEIARARTSDDERGSSPFGREQAATPPYIFPLMPRAGFNGRNTGGEEGAGAREARRREASRRLHRRAQRVNVRA